MEIWEEKYLGMEIIWEKTFRYGNLDEKFRFRNSEENQKGIVFLSEKQRFLPRRAKRNENNLYNCIFGQKSPPKGAKFFWDGFLKV